MENINKCTSLDYLRGDKEVDLKRRRHSKLIGGRLKYLFENE